MPLPPVPDAFYWTDQSWGAALRCRPLDEVAPHLFTTRQLELTADEDVQRLAQALGVERALLLKQVHGRAVVRLRGGEAMPDLTGSGARNRPEADAIVSDAPDVAVVVRAADCVPLLMADRRSGVVAAVHAGWRGTAAGAAAAALDVMRGEFGTQPGDVIVAIGPSIGPCCYEVGPDVVDAFAAAGHARHLIERWFLETPPSTGTYTPTAARGAPHPLRLDVAGSNRDQLMLAGVAEKDIHLCGLCTAEHLDVLTSYRAEGAAAGRIAGVIRSRRPT